MCKKESVEARGGRTGFSHFCDTNNYILSDSTRGLGNAMRSLASAFEKKEKKKICNRRFARMKLQDMRRRASQLLARYILLPLQLCVLFTESNLTVLNESPSTTIY